MKIEVLPHRQLSIERVLLTDDALNLFGQGRMGHHVDATHKCPAFGRNHPGGQHAGRGGLTGAVRTEQPEDLSCPHREIEPIHRPEIGTLVHLGQAFGANDALISITWGEGHV